MGDKAPGNAQQHKMTVFTVAKTLTVAQSGM